MCVEAWKNAPKCNEESPGGPAGAQPGRTGSEDAARDNLAVGRPPKGTESLPASLRSGLAWEQRDRAPSSSPLPGGQRLAVPPAPPCGSQASFLAPRRMRASGVPRPRPPNCLLRSPAAPPAPGSAAGECADPDPRYGPASVEASTDPDPVPCVSPLLSGLVVRPCRATS